MLRAPPPTARTQCAARTQVVAGAKFRPLSRIGKQLIPLPEGVQVNLDGPGGRKVHCVGEHGEIRKEFNSLVSLELVDDQKRGRCVKVSRTNDSKKASQMHGTARAITAHLVKGVNEGYTKVLKLVGVGYRARMEDNYLTMTLGYRHPRKVRIPSEVQIDIEKNTRITLQCNDLELIGNLAAVIRGHRPPEPYKGKGIRYEDERVMMRPGKSGK